jgi:AraC family transcriptional regulator, transcriptional activator of pobA
MNQPDNHPIGKKTSFGIYRIEENSHENHTLSLHNSFKIILVKQGSGCHSIDFDKYEVTEDSLHCVVPGRKNLFDSANAEGYMIIFTAGFLSFYEDTLNMFSPARLFNTFLNCPVTKVDEQMKRQLVEIAERMIGESKSTFSGSAEILGELLKMFLICFNQVTMQPHQQFNQSRNKELVSRFLMLLERNYATHKMVADYAKQLTVTPNYLNEIVKKVSGFPASHHIQQRIILEAKRKAAHVSMSMKEVAYHLGFDDISHFSKFFKNVSGINFTAFKKEISQRFSFAG